MVTITRYQPQGENIHSYASEIKRKFNLLFIRKIKQRDSKKFGEGVVFVFHMSLIKKKTMNQKNSNTGNKIYNFTLLITNKAEMKHPDLMHITLSLSKKKLKKEKNHMPPNSIMGYKRFHVYMGLENDPSPFMHSPYSFITN